jgi:hypothetical protein
MFITATVSRSTFRKYTSCVKEESAMKFGFDLDEVVADMTGELIAHLKK